MNGTLQFVALEKLGDLGPERGEKVEVRWYFFYDIMWILLWLCLVFLLRMEENRGKGLWKVLVIPAIFQGLLFAESILIGEPDLSVLLLYGFVPTIGLAVVPLVPWVWSEPAPGTAFRRAFIVAFATGLAFYLSFMMEFNFVAGIILGLSLLAMMLPVLVAGRSSRKAFTKGKFLLWTLLWLLVFLAIPIVLYVGFMFVMYMMEFGSEMIMFIIIWPLMFIGMMTGIVYVFMLMPPLLFMLNMPRLNRRLVRVYPAASLYQPVKDKVEALIEETKQADAGEEDRSS